MISADIVKQREIIIMHLMAITYFHGDFKETVFKAS